MNDTGIRGTARDPHLDSVCRIATALFGTQFASVTVLDAVHQRFIGADGYTIDRTPRIVAICDWAVRGGPNVPFIVHDTQADPRFADNPLVIGPPYLRFYAGVPLASIDEAYTATLCVTDVRPRPDFGEAQLRHLQDMAGLVETHLQTLAVNDRLQSEIVDRRRLESALRETSALFQATVEAIDQGLIVTNALDYVRVHNRRVGPMLGVPSALLHDGASFAAVRRHQVEAGESNNVPAPLQRWLESGTPEVYVPDYERIRPNGTVLEVHSLPMANGGMVRTCRDVTERHRADSALRESERRYRLIAENATDIIVLNDLGFTRRYLSPAVQLILGYEPSELIGSVASDIVHPDDRSKFIDLMADLRDKRLERAMLVQRYRHRDGRWVWLEVSFGLTRDMDTGQPDGFVGTMRDITARRVADDALRASEARYRTLAEALPQIVLIAEVATGETLYANSRFSDYYGEIGPTKADRLALIHLDDQHAMRLSWAQACAGAAYDEIEVRLRRHDGVYRWHKVLTEPVTHEGGIAALLYTALDIHDIVTARRELEQASQMLRFAQGAAGAGIWEWDPAADRMILSPVSARLHGINTDEPEMNQVITLAEWKARVEPKDLPAVWKAVRRNLTSGDTNVAEFRTHAPDQPGGYRWVQSFGRAIRDELGGAVRFVGLHLDVTERREVEESLRRREAQLRVSEERFALALDSGEDCLFDWDLVTGTVWVSRRWRERLGLVGASAHPTTAAWCEVIHPDDRVRVTKLTLAHLKGLTRSIECEYRVRLADGDMLWVCARARVAGRSPDGRAQRLVGTLIDISVRKAADARMARMAMHDALTDLPNRYAFRAHLDRVISCAGVTPNRQAVLVCDLDRFKAVNDTFGHVRGDRLLCVVAERIRTVVREQGAVSRLGGDEFAVILDHIDDVCTVENVSTRVIAALATPIMLDGVPVQIGVSIGGVVVVDDGASAEDVFHRADTALYRAKAAGRNTYRLFEADAHARNTARSLLALDMREAIRRGEFALVYQPVIDVVSNTVASFEALMRWHHPVHGLISPAEFIPVAEETGMIVQLGAWALGQACQEALSWPECVRVAVNVSTVQFRGDLEGAVRDALTKTGLAPTRLKLEVTESILAENPDAALAVLHRLRNQGVKIALDDFGTGYSSLSYLRQFPFDKLKIDRSFIRDIADPDAAAIVRAVVGIGERLSMGIVAEGVETEAQLDLVRREGCTEVQGFLFSRPLSAEDARTFAVLDIPLWRKSS